MTHTQSHEDFEKQIQALEKENAELKAALAERDRTQGVQGDGKSDFKPLFKYEAEVYRKLFDQAGYGITLVGLLKTIMELSMCIAKREKALLLTSIFQYPTRK